MKEKSGGTERLFVLGGGETAKFLHLHFLFKDWPSLLGLLFPKQGHGVERLGVISLGLVLGR